MPKGGTRNKYTIRKRCGTVRSIEIQAGRGQDLRDDPLVAFLFPELAKAGRDGTKPSEAPPPAPAPGDDE